MNTYKCARINCALFYSLMKLSNDEFSSYKKITRLVMYAIIEIRRNAIKHTRR